MVSVCEMRQSPSLRSRAEEYCEQPDSDKQGQQQSRPLQDRGGVFGKPLVGGRALLFGHGGGSGRQELSLPALQTPDRDAEILAHLVHRLALQQAQHGSNFLVGAPGLVVRMMVMGFEVVLSGSSCGSHK